MESLTERLEEIQEELGSSDFDVEYSVRRASLARFIWKLTRLSHSQEF